MLPRIVEIAENNRQLSLFRGFLVVSSTVEPRVELGRVALDDIGAVVANAHGINYTNNVLCALAQRGIPFVLCADNHQVVGMLWATDGNFEQSRRMDAQIAASLPTKKRLWADVVRAKLEQQAACLSAVGASNASLLRLSKQVRSGDPNNFEAQGSRAYWVRLFGSSFRRDQDGQGINALLNYGYAILRAATARAVIAAGLHAGLGVHHSNAGNAMRLVDDLMEPFRPFIDIKVWQLSCSDQTLITPETKRELVMALYEDVPTDTGVTPVIVAVQRLATSLALCYVGERKALDLPLPGLALRHGR